MQKPKTYFCACGHETQQKRTAIAGRVFSMRFTLTASLKVHREMGDPDSLINLTRSGLRVSWDEDDRQSLDSVSASDDPGSKHLLEDRTPG